MLLNMTGAPPEIWLLALTHVCYILNHTAVESLKWRTPIECLTGSTPDISAIMLFLFWEKIYYKNNDAAFPSESNERLGRFVGIADSVGHALTFKVLTEDTSKIIYRSEIRTATNPNVRNLRIDPVEDNSNNNDVLKSKHDDDIKNGIPMPTIDPSELIGRTYLKNPEEDGSRYRAKIVALIDEHENGLANHPDRVKFRCSVNDNDYEEIVSYNDIINHIEKDDLNSDEWKFKDIIGHQGPLSKGDKNYKGSRFNVLVSWETGESTYEPLHIIAVDDPVSCAIYAKKNNLLEEEGWKRLKLLARRQKKLIRLQNQAKLKPCRNRKVYKFGVLVPRDHNHAMEIDTQNGNKNWHNAEKLELSQLEEYKTFIDKGKKIDKFMDTKR